MNGGFNQMQFLILGGVVIKDMKYKSSLFYKALFELDNEIKAYRFPKAKVLAQKTSV